MNSHNEAQTSEEPTIIVGLVDPFGSFGGPSFGELWIYGSSFYAWRDANGILHRDKLALRAEMTWESLRSHMDRIRAYGIVKVRINIREDHSAEFLELLDEAVDTDTELTQIAVELQKPLTYEHERFGTFTFDRRIAWWGAKTDWLGKTIELYLPGDEASGPFDSVLQTAIQLWDNQAYWSQRISDYAVQELLPTKNDYWLDEDKDEQPLSPDEFKSRMTLVSIVADDDEEGEFSFSYDDDEMFSYHSINVRGSLSEGPTRASL